MRKSRALWQGEKRDAVKSPAVQPAAAIAPKVPLVTAQPQSQQEAAAQKDLFLFTDDSWSQNYFNNNDLHSLQRQLFG
jgi:hypothetical protein